MVIDQAFPTLPKSPVERGATSGGKSTQQPGRTIRAVRAERTELLLVLHQFEEAAYLLLVDGLTHVEAFYLVEVALAREADFNDHIAGVLIGKAEDVEGARLLVGRCVGFCS